MAVYWFFFFFAIVIKKTRIIPAWRNHCLILMFFVADLRMGGNL